MFTKTKTALVAALVIGSASVAMADDRYYPPEQIDNYAYSNPSQSNPSYNQAPAWAPRGTVIEGRNVGVAGSDLLSLPNEQRRQIDRNSADFNS